LGSGRHDLPRLAISTLGYSLGNPGFL
jgi:hypothetical protein